MESQQPQPDSMTVRVTSDTHSEVVTQVRTGSVSDCDHNKCFVVSPSDNEKKEETQRQAWFENAIKKKLKIPNSYVQVAPLIIRWDSGIDEYSKGHDHEVSDRSAVRLLFNFIY